MFTLPLRDPLFLPPPFTVFIALLVVPAAGSLKWQCIMEPIFTTRILKICIKNRFKALGIVVIEIFKITTLWFHRHGAEIMLKARIFIGSSGGSQKVPGSPQTPMSIGRAF